MCDSFSDPANARTIDGVSTAPRNMTVKCYFNHSTHESIVRAAWETPEKPRGKIVDYFVMLYGNATYLDAGRQSLKEIGPVNKTVSNHTYTEFTGQQPNTKIFVRLDDCCTYFT